MIVIAVSDEDAFDLGSEHQGDGVVVAVAETRGEQFVVAQASCDLEVRKGKIAADYKRWYHFK